jgi:hypothetical protein
MYGPMRLMYGSSARAQTFSMEAFVPQASISGSRFSERPRSFFLATGPAA